MRRKVSYTLPIALVDKLTDISKRYDESQSSIIESALRRELLRMEKDEMDRLAEIGYSAMTGEDAAVAESDMASWSKLLGNDDWDVDWSAHDE